MRVRVEGAPQHTRAMRRAARHFAVDDANAGTGAWAREARGLRVRFRRQAQAVGLAPASSPAGDQPGRLARFQVPAHRLRGNGYSRLSASSAQGSPAGALCGIRLRQLAGDVSVRRRTRRGCRVSGLSLGEQAMAMKTPVHPGAIVREDCLKPLGLSVTEGAKRLGVGRQTLSNLVNEKASVSEGDGLFPAFEGLRLDARDVAWHAVGTMRYLARSRQLRADDTDRAFRFESLYRTPPRRPWMSSIWTIYSEIADPVRHYLKTSPVQEHADSFPNQNGLPQPRSAPHFQHSQAPQKSDVGHACRRSWLASDTKQSM